MKRVFSAAILIIIAALLVALAQTPSQTAKSPLTNALQDRGEQYLYERFFAHVTRINQQADEADRLGMNSSYLRSQFQRTAQLQVSQAVLLNEVAAELAANMAQYDARAAEAKKNWHVLVQTKRRNHEPIPPIPAEILGLKAGRDALVAQARDRLRLGLGDAEFSRLDGYIRAKKPWKEEGEVHSQAGTTGNSAPPMPERAAYQSLLTLVTHLKAKAEEERALGFPELADGIHSLVQRQAGLSAEQARILEQVAAEYFQALDALKPQAEAARLPYRRLCLEMLARDGKITATPEFIAARNLMTAVVSQADSLTDGSIQRLRRELGEQEFARFDAFVKQRMKRPSTPTGTAVQEVAQ